MIRRLRKRLALLLSLVLCLSVFPVTAYAGDGEMITISKRAPVDIVFVLDSTSSMSSQVGLVKSKITAFLEKLYKYNKKISAASDKGIGIDPRIAIVDFKDVTVPGEVTTFHKNRDGGYWFVSGDELTDAVTNIAVSGGGDGPETPTEALAKLYKADDGVDDVEGFEWRTDAQKFVFLITDADFKDRSNRADIPNLSEVTEELSKRNIKTSVVTNSTYKNKYSPLYTGTDGKCYDYNTLDFMEEFIREIDNLDITYVKVSIVADGAPDGIGSVKLARYTDKDGAEQESPAVYCGDDSASVNAAWDSLAELEINSKGTKNGAAAPDRKTYVIDKITVNGEQRYLSESGKFNSHIHGLPIKTGTTVQVLFKENDGPALYTVSFDSAGGSQVPPQDVLEGERASLPDNPERAGYTFNYWYLFYESIPYDFNAPITTDLTLKASWSLIEKEEKDDNGNTEKEEPPEGLPSDWTKLKHVTHENTISSDYCVIARKQRFDVKPHIHGAVIYRSSDKKIASVRKKSGIVKGKQTGDAVITGYFKSGGQLIPTGSYTIHVVTPELTKKQYLSFNTDGYVDGNEHVVNEILIPTVWTSSNPSVATVSPNSGMISVLKSKGKVRINAFYGLGRNAARYRFTLRIRPSGGAG